MKFRAYVLIMAIVVSSGSSADGQPICTIRDGDAEFSVNADGTFDFKPDGTVDHLFEIGAWYRRNGVDNQEHRILNIVDFNCAGSRGTFLFSENDFDLTAIFTLTDGPGPGQATVNIIEEYVNTGEGDLSLSIFNYFDLDVGGTPGGDEAVLISSDLIRVTDQADGGDFLDIEIDDADAYQVAEWPGLLDLLDDFDIDDLDNSGLPFGPGDFTGAFQSELLIPNRGERIITGRLAANIPEPASLSLLGLMSLAVLPRRRTAKTPRAPRTPRTAKV